jgi:hypothetical protein
MARSIREKTIQRFEEMLAKEKNPEKRRILEMLLEQEREDQRQEKTDQRD